MPTSARTEPLRILIVTQWFEPEPVCRGFAFAKELVRRGHTVTVLTGFPNYPHGVIYKGFSQSLSHSENIEGVTLLRVPLYISHDTNAKRRAMNYLSFMVSTAFFGLFRAPAFDVAYVYHPPITTALAGLFICKIRRKPFICDIQDLWPDSVAATGMVNNSRVTRVLGWACDLVYRQADSISVISKGFRTKLLERGVPDEKIAIIGNWCDESILRKPDDNGIIERYRSHFDQNFTIVFAGNIGEAQNLGVAINAALVAHQINPLIHFVFIGGGTQYGALKRRCEVEGISCVSFIPHLPMNEVGSILELADALLIHLSDDPLFEITIPSKTQAAMAIGKPVLMAVRGEACELIEECHGGIIAQPDDCKSIANAAVELAGMSSVDRHEMGQRALQAYESQFARKLGVSRFEVLFHKAVATVAINE